MKYKKFNPLLVLSVLTSLFFTGCIERSSYQFRTQKLINTLPSHIADDFRQGHIDSVVQYLDGADKSTRNSIENLKKSESVIFFSDKQFISFYFNSIYKKAIDKSLHF